MPKMDGPAVAREIHLLIQTSLQLTPKDCPYIVCCSAYGEAQVVESALAAGMDEFMIKPLHYDNIKLLCENHLLRQLTPLS